MRLNEEALDAVQRGAELLDQHKPGWHRLIDLKTLDLSDCDACLCGQLAFFTHATIAFQAFDPKTDQLITRPRRVSSMAKKSGYGSPYYLFRKWLKKKTDGYFDPGTDAQYGFDVSSNTSYDDLDRAWKHLIRGRLRKEARAAA